jgi:hypothetical protein
MAARKDAWTREQLIVALEFYCRTPFGKLHSKNPEIVKLAGILGRTPGALAMKLSNFAKFDPVLRERGIRGLSRTAAADENIWHEFHGKWEELAILSAKIKTSLGQAHKSANLPEFILREMQPHETESTGLMKIRRVQGFFRDAVLSSYEFMCGFCGFSLLPMLNASHIIPWSQTKTQRADPQNGIALCAFHDRAFDRGYMAVTADLRIMVSPEAKKVKDSQMHRIGLLALEGKVMNQPIRFGPDPVALTYHREKIFRR